ncbi:Hypothetical predicted protein [Marmota monax]|uniref:Mucin-2 n=1 Tax=Marmota monax TaxID=9995 RepID=A0A5E4AWJ3_MARMO|nr:Hypothetical predicted protein [Marmota monax]
MVGLWLLLLLPHGGALLSTALKKGWCSSWGAGHFSTFDHHAYDFLGTCNYIFAASCKGASPTFSVQLRRGADGNISRIIVELGSSVVTVNETTISIKDIGVVSLPYTSHGLQITPYGQSVQLVAKQVELELVVMWGPDAHLMVRTGGLGRGIRAQGGTRCGDGGGPGSRSEWPGQLGRSPSCTPWGPAAPALQVLVERKYMGQMCGLCGNFDGKTANEFLSEDGKLLEPYKYAALQKLDDPNEICTFEAIPRPPVLQATHVGICTQLLTLVSPECDVPKKPLVLSCQVDMAACAQPGQQNCSCATLSEYSRRCSMAHRPVSNWRGPGLCSVGQCPANQVYQECGTACIRTCSNPQHSCSSPCTFGCFCPKGMVLNDLSNNHTCVPVSQCPCMLNGVAYSPGEVVRAACQSCQCTMGHWTCTGQPCPGHCSLEGGSFVTTFDARPYRFHGTCTYILLQSPQLPNEGTLMAVYDKSGYSHSETSLVAIVYLSGQDKIVISEDEVTNNGDTKWLPYQTRNITIFRQTSTHLQMATTFGLEIVVQRQPVFQVYITLGPQFRGQTRGLCGNFNGNTTDEFTSSAGIDEGTAALFVDSWRAGNCPAALEREIDPCSMSQLNKMYAETHCSVLLKKDGVFEKCHAVLDPKPFYKRCVYQACNYEETFPHICAALGAYVHACSSQAVLLGDWRDSVYNCTIPCTGNRTFSQQSQACDHTCLSLSNREVECHPSAVPVDGCNCPDGTYLDHRNECVHKAQCPCLLESHKFILAGQSTMVNGIIWCGLGLGVWGIGAQAHAASWGHWGNRRCSWVRTAAEATQRGTQRHPWPPSSETLTPLSTPAASCPAPKTFQSCSQSSEDKFGAACAPTCQMLATGITCVSGSEKQLRGLERVVTGPGGCSALTPLSPSLSVPAASVGCGSGVKSNSVAKQLDEHAHLQGSVGAGPAWGTGRSGPGPGQPQAGSMEPSLREVALPRKTPAGFTEVPGKKARAGAAGWGCPPGNADPAPSRCPLSVSLAASVLRGSTRIPVGSVCSPGSAPVTLRGSPTPGVLCSAPTARTGKPHLTLGAQVPGTIWTDKGHPGTCSQGRWTCQQSAHCPSTCILYGEGHIITFDGQRFVFNGNCKYTLATDDCGANSQPSFKILVENVVCGKSGATCSRAIQILLGVSSGTPHRAGEGWAHHTARPSLSRTLRASPGQMEGCPPGGRACSHTHWNLLPGADSQQVPLPKSLMDLGLTITMADRNYSISGENSQVHVLVKPSSLNLVLDIDIPNRLNMTLVWNKHMSVSIRVHRASQDALCGLCGNCNGNMKDDFETRSKYVASNELEFVNSWKESPLCRDASYAEDPCSLNPFRRPWAERKCSIIHSQTFTACHSKVYRMPYYEACVRDACLCDKGGDCECLCDAVAAYAKACLDKGVCVDWRAPDFCPIYCDFYNTHSQVGDGKFQYTQEANCTWHYQPCLCPGRLDSFPDTNVEGTNSLLHPQSPPFHLAFHALLLTVTDSPHTFTQQRPGPERG